MGREGATFSRGRTYYVTGVGILFDHGTTVPTDGLPDYAPGCIFQDTDGAADANFYINQGSLTSCNFDPLDIGTILASNVPILDTAAWFTATNTETVLAELGELLLANSTVEGGVGPSPLIWKGAPILDVILDPTKGFYYWNDYDKYSGMSLAATGDSGDLTYTERTDGLCANMPTLPGGIVQLDSVVVTVDQGGTIQHLGVQCEPADGTVIRMEWRCLVDADSGQCFMGLCDDSITAPVTSSDEITINNHAGFYRDAGTGSAAWTVGIGDGGTIEEDEDAATSVLSTYHTFGMVITGIGAVAGSKVEFYFDGVLIFTTTDISDMPLLLMCPAFQMDADGANVIMQIDWLRILVTNATNGGRET